MNRFLKRGAPLLAVSTLLAMSAPALAQNQLPSVRGASGPLDTAPVAQVLPNGGSPCVVGAAGCSLPTSQGGSTGTDYSANTPTLPNIGANFAASGPYASYVLVATVPAHTAGCLYFLNASGAQIVVVTDDGTAASGTAPHNATAWPVAAGAGSGAQGSGADSQWCSFKGRAQFYAPSTVTSPQVPVALW